MDLSWSIKGDEALQRRLDRVEEGLAGAHAVTNALLAAAEVVVGDAKKRTPVDTGALRSNVILTPWNVSRSGGEVNIAYMMEYAPYVHERLEAQHPVGEAKFLENAINDQTVRERALKVLYRFLAKKIKIGY